MNTIKVKYGLEEITSRIPGLFPYIEFDENNVSLQHYASDSDNGCYGKIVCSIHVPNGVFLDIVVDTETRHIIEPDKTYTYRTLMNVYYQYREEYPDNTFIKFMDKGIGKFYITMEDILLELPQADLTDFDNWILIPEYEYYADCARLYDEYANIGIMCDKYIQMKNLTGEVNCELECLVEKYTNMGGDVLRDYYKAKAGKAYEIANEYYDYIGDEFNLSFNVNITADSSDLGVVNTFLEYFDPKREYHSGECTIYNDRSYMCVEDFDSNEKYLLGSYTKRNQFGYICINKEGHIGEWNNDDFNLIGNVIQLDGNNASFILLSENYSHQENITGTTNSVLTGFRNNLNYLNEGGVIKTPEFGVDWLWYYMVGDVGYSETTTDRLNNIEVSVDEQYRETTPGEYEYHLLAYGDIIKSIDRDTVNRTITFTYIIGAHLRAKLTDIGTDDDGNTRYYYGDYEYDERDPHGVIHTETYSYNDGGDIDNMSDGEDGLFNHYINNDKSVAYTGDGNITIIKYIKGEFNTSSRMVSNETMVNGVPVNYSYISSDFVTDFNEEKDTLVNPITKFDYLTGVSYVPTVKNDVHINRGNAAAWERHMKLGEMKSLEDLEDSHIFNLR